MRPKKCRASQKRRHRIARQSGFRIVEIYFLDALHKFLDIKIYLLEHRFRNRRLRLLRIALDSRLSALDSRSAAKPAAADQNRIGISGA